MVGQEIVRVASQFINLYETKSNAAWANILDPTKGKAESDELDKAMLECGWSNGLPYCAAFAEAMCRIAYNNLKAPDSVSKRFSSSMTPSVMTSYNNFHKLGLITQVPTPGSLFFMQKGTSFEGHTGIVVANNGATLATIEGNTSAGTAISAEADRNGDGIFKKVRTNSFEKSAGLHLIGFLQPLTW